MTTLFLKPAADGAVVRMPDRQMRALKAEGERVDDSQYWRLRLLHGDVVEAADADASGAPTDAADHREEEYPED